MGRGVAGGGCGSWHRDPALRWRRCHAQDNYGGQQVHVRHALYVNCLVLVTRTVCFGSECPCAIDNLGGLAGAYTRRTLFASGFLMSHGVGFDSCACMVSVSLFLEVN